jgi:zinc protease
LILNRAQTKTMSKGSLCGATISEHRLRNGLRVLIAERHLDPVVAAMIFYRVGSCHEKPEEAGLSHFLEHMMFKGTAQLGKGEVDRITTCLGGSNNAFTTPDHTAYWFELASDRWESALKIEADRMQGLLLDPAEFEAEKAVVLEELAMGLDDPWRRLSRAVQEILFGRHPYGRPVIGYADILHRAGPAEMREYYSRFYQPANATVVLCGDLNPSSALKQVRKHLGGLQGDFDSDAAPYRPAPPEPDGECRVQLSWDDPTARMIMAWPTTAVGTDVDFAFDVLTTILTAGRLSRMYRTLVLEKGLATSISTSNDTRAEGGAFWLYAEAAPGVNPADLESAIDDELGQLHEHLVRPAEMKRAKALLIAGAAAEGETVSDLAEHIGGYAMDAEWTLTLELSERRKKVTANALRSVVREYLGSQRRVVGWSLPGGADPEKKA